MSESTYLWLVFWEDRFVQPQRVEVREVTRLQGVSDTDLERHLIEVAAVEQARHSTRVGGVRSQVLLRLGGERTEATGFGTADEGVAVPLEGVAAYSGRSAEVVWSSEDLGFAAGPEPSRPSSEEPSA